VEEVPVRCRIDTPIEIDYYQHGGILPYVLRSCGKGVNLEGCIPKKWNLI